MSGVDSLESSQADMVERAKRWLTNNGIKICESAKIEISSVSFPAENDLVNVKWERIDLSGDFIYLE